MKNFFIFSCDKYKGFTLMELLIAVLIFSIVILTLFSSFDTFIISSTDIKAKLEKSDKIQTLFKRVSLDLEALYISQPPFYKKPSFNSESDLFRLVGNQENIGQIMASFIVFASSAHAITSADNKKGIARISYYLKENKNNLYDLYRSDSLFIENKEIRSCFDLILCKDISGFKIVYKNEQNEEFEYWDSETKEFGYTFPSSIEINISFGKKEKRQVFGTLFPIVTKRDEIE